MPQEVILTAGNVEFVNGNDEQQNLLLIILISCVATIGGFLFGFDSGVINGTVDGLRLAFNSDSVGTGFKAPSLSDLFFPGFGNPDLAPETSVGIDAGVECGQPIS